MKKLFLLILSAATILNAFAQLPASIPYPYQPPNLVVQQAQEISDSLEAYILKWTQGLVPSAIPNSLIPQGISDSKNFYLKDPDSVSLAETWAVRYAKPINKDSLLTGIPDPKITYLFLGTAFAPFGSKLIVEGEFPHCRFFSFQISPPVNGLQYYAQRQFGTAEVSVADADIEPLPGHTNPFRVGADRTATNRSYKMEFDLTTGDPTALNDSGHIYPYRQNINNRKGAMMVYQGPLGTRTLLGTPLANGGDWDLGCLWVRIYEPDENTNALGGVPMPKVYFQLPNGSKYFIGSDFSILQRRADTTSANRVVVSQPNPNIGSDFGWVKSFGITRGILNGICVSNAWFNQRDSIRNTELGWTGRGENQPAPGNIEPHATTNNYASYVGRAITVPPGMVAVLTGKLPTFPSTRHGEPIMTAADVRYWSICGLDQDPFSPMPATTVHAISDDDVKIDADRNYVIAYSRIADRPNNADTANGVSWVDWGTQSDLGVLMRWVCVAPDWRFAYAPHENNLDYKHADWASAQYDSTLIGVNWRNGFMKCYLPTVHYMTKAEFEALGTNIRAENVPVWVDSSYSKAGPAESQWGNVRATSVADTLASNAVSNLNDGKMTTFWSSLWGQPNVSVVVDLDTVKKISAVKLNWDWVFFGKDYSLSISTDSVNWTNIATVTNENGQVDLYKNLPNILGRYVKLDLTNYNVGYYRLAEFEVYTNDWNCPEMIQIPTALETDLNQNSELKIFPNPAQQMLNVQIANPDFKTGTAKIFSLVGQLVQQQLVSDKNSVINVSTLSKGIYFLQVEGGKNKWVKKFIRE